MLTRIRRDNQDGSDFDALEFELKHAEDFENSQKQYFEPAYEIDCESDWCGSLYRVWDRRLLIGTFYQKQGKWLSSPYYQNRQYMRLEKDLDKTCSSNEMAINHIVTSYEGR